MFHMYVNNHLNIVHNSAVSLVSLRRLQNNVWSYTLRHTYINAAGLNKLSTNTIIEHAYDRFQQYLKFTVYFKYF